MFLAELRRWGDRCSYKMHSLADRAYITGRVFSALGLLTLPREFLVWGKVQNGSHYHCSGACSSNTFLVCKKVQRVLYYKGFLVRKKVVWSFNTLQSDFKIRKSAAEVGLDGIDCQTCSRGYDIGWMKLMVEEVTSVRLDEIDVQTC